MRSYKWICVVAAMVVLMVAGCQPPITCGNIQSKDFVPEHEEEEYSEIKIGDVSIPTYNTYTVPDEWYITIEMKDENDKLRTRVYKVDERTYDAHNVGDWIDFGE